MKHYIINVSTDAQQQQQHHPSPTPIPGQQMMAAWKEKEIFYLN